MTPREKIEAKRAAVVARWKDITENATIELLAGMWDERQLDALVLVLGIGRVELD
jgi:hypothetical protein